MSQLTIFQTESQIRALKSGEKFTQKYHWKNNFYEIIND